MLSRQPEEGQGLFDGILGPACQARIACRPFGKPCGKISPGLCEIAPVVEPAQFLQAVVAVLPRQMIERVPEEVHVAALPGGFGDHLADRCHQAGVIVGHNQLDALEAARLEADEEVPPGRAALAIGHLHARIWRLPSQSIPTAISTAWLMTTPASRTFS